jgi:hypothetical protein
MAIEKLSAQDPDPQPVPKEQIVDDSEGVQLDEDKLKQFFIGSIDQGTTSTRFIIFDGLGEPVAQHQIEFSQMYPQSGSVSQRSSCEIAPLTGIDGMNTIQKRLSQPLRSALTEQLTSSWTWVMRFRISKLLALPISAKQRSYGTLTRVNHSIMQLPGMSRPCFGRDTRLTARLHPQARHKDQRIGPRTEEPRRS